MPTKVLADMIAIVSGLIQDQAGKLNSAARTEAVRDAIVAHSAVVPARKFQVVTGVSNYVVSLPTGWVHEVSQTIQIEYPLGNRPPTYLDEDEYQVIAMPTGSVPYKLMLLNLSSSTAQIGVRFTAPHTFGATAAQNTLPDDHLRPVAHLAAAIACRRLAAFYTQSNDSMIQADSVNHQQKNTYYLELAKRFERFYRDYFHIGEEHLVRPASVVVDIDRQFQWQEDFFFHEKRWR